MKCNSKYMVFIAFCLCFFFSCSDDEGTKENPFGNGESDTFIKVTNSSNADTLYLSWELTDTKVSFDNYKFELEKPKTIKTVGKDETKFYFTHVPYNEPVSISISLIKKDEVIKNFSTKVKIDGLDKKISGIIIPDQGSVTGGDGMYSIPLPDGRSIFLMGDSYIGTVTNGQRSASDHMYRNTYIVYNPLAELIH